MRLLRHWPIFFLALWFAGMTILLDRAVGLFTERTTTDPAGVAAPAPWRASRLFVDPDSYAWLSYARDLRESPHFRVRFTRMDNPPFGRAVHWAQLPIWGLCALATAFEAAGIPSPPSLELAGRILLPLLGFLFSSALWLVLRKRISPGLAALVALSAAVVLFWDFHPLRPDHHGFHLAATAAFLIPLLFSSFGFAPPTRRNRLPFILSGFFGGTALWLGATVFYFSLAAVAIAAALTLLTRPPASAPQQDALVWRFWGLSGFASSLFFYLLEYAPNHFSMRLEANHPLYSLSFLGIGECLCLLARLRHGPSPRFSLRFLLHAALALAAAASLPLLVLFGPVAWYLPRTTLMLRLHARHIAEFLPLHVDCANHGRSLPLFVLRPVLPAIGALPFLFRRPWPRRVSFAFPFFALFLLLALFQVRWRSFASLAAFLFLLAAAGMPPTRPFLRFFPHAFLLLQLALELSFNTSPLPSFLRGRSTDSAYLRAAQCRAVAAQFRPALASPAVTPTPNASSPAVLAPPELGPYLWYFARIPAVASLYWENLSGNAAAAKAFADPAPDAPDARAVVESRRISHLFMFEGFDDALLFDHLNGGVLSSAHASKTLAATLANAGPGVPLPPWLAVDTDLNRLANPPLYVYVPPDRVSSLPPFSLRIYSLMPPSAP